MKKEETNDIVQHLLPRLSKVGIRTDHCKVDTTTGQTGRWRGDVWVSRSEQTALDFESNIVGLIEAKHRNCEIGDMDWRDAMEQGKKKAETQNLNFYAVTNCVDSHRFYNRFTDEEITLDGKFITRLQPLEVLEKIQAQVSVENSHVVHRTSTSTLPMSESKFRRALQNLANTYRACGLKKGDERIDPTVSFVILKYIGEQEKDKRTLTTEVKLWDDYGDQGNYKADFRSSTEDIFSGDYGETYKDFKELVKFPSALQNEHYKQIYDELSRFHFHRSNFDIFGAIYEEFASQTKKKEFGEFYTRRHITGVVARLLLRNETTPRPLKICDPACGTGGFLTESYKALVENYEKNGKMNPEVTTALQRSTFWGFDNDKKSVARTKLNMFLTGDGHTHIYHVEDSLVGSGGKGFWVPKIGWKENEFDYILANPPMGKYDGKARREDFQFTNDRRYEMLFAEKIVSATKPGQDMAIVVPDGVLEAPSREQFRKKLLDNCDVHAVVSLTRFAFAPYTKEKTYVLFMRKKQAEEVGQRQEFPIWHFIVDYDGFANSDKRYKTKAHDDLPELEEKFDGALKLARLYLTDRAYFDEKRAEFERTVHDQEKKEGLTGKKYGFVEMAEVGEGNFHNLLSEFHLRPIEARQTAVTDFYAQAVQIAKHLSQLRNELGSLDQPSAVDSQALITQSFVNGDDAPTSTEPASALFNVHGGNSGLTEEFIYNNPPLSEMDSVEILTGATLEQNRMGHVAKDAVLENGRKLKTWDEDCIILTRKGNAGTMTFVSGKTFATNDDAYVLVPKAKWKGKINLQWFVHQYQAAFWNAVTSKSDNATFNTQWMKRIYVTIPALEVQNAVAERVTALRGLLTRFSGIERAIHDVLSLSPATPDPRPASNASDPKQPDLFGS